ncbi:hypothetical protein DSECCO2_317610 [anaerobic digester metagenome]
MSVKVKNKFQIFLAIIKIVFTFAVPKIKGDELQIGCNRAKVKTLIQPGLFNNN